MVERGRTGGGVVEKGRGWLKGAGPEERGRTGGRVVERGRDQQRLVERGVPGTRQGPEEGA